MSDDPTQHYEQLRPDAPTERLAQPADAVPTGAPAAPVADPSSRRLVIILASVGGALLLAVLVLLAVLLTRGAAPVATPSATPSVAPSATPSPSPTASKSPTPTPTPTAPAPAPTPTPAKAPPPSTITSYTASSTTVACGGQTSVPVTFSWSATGKTLWFGVGTDNAKAAPYGEFPLNYTMSFAYQCGQPGGKQKYAITVESTTGTLSSQTIVIKEN